MKPSALLFALLLLTACASSNDGFIDQSVNTCASSQLIEMEAGLDMPGMGMEKFSANAIAHVQLSNNSDEDVTVKTIRVDPRIHSPLEYELLNGYLEVGAVLKEAESEQYEIPLSIRERDSVIGNDPRNVNSRTTNADLDVTVVLTNGQTYRCQFRVVVPMSV